MTTIGRLKKIMNAANNIILIGMMGSGKSTVGKILADSLKFDFVDLDEFIEKNEAMAISDIFAKQGEDYFRKLEFNAAKETIHLQDTVISTGGGIIKNEANIAALKKAGTVFYLSAPANILYRRIKGDSARPLLKTEEEFAKILEERENAYKQADFMIDATKSPEEIAQEIIEIFGRPKPWK